MPARQAVSALAGIERRIMQPQSSPTLPALRQQAAPAMRGVEHRNMQSVDLSAPPGLPREASPALSGVDNILMPPPVAPTPTVHPQQPSPALSSSGRPAIQSIPEHVTPANPISSSGLIASHVRQPQGSSALPARQRQVSQAVNGSGRPAVQPLTAAMRPVNMQVSLALSGSGRLAIPLQGASLPPRPPPQARPTSSGSRDILAELQQAARSVHVQPSQIPPGLTGAELRAVQPLRTTFPPRQTPRPDSPASSGGKHLLSVPQRGSPAPPGPLRARTSPAQSINNRRDLLQQGAPASAGSSAIVPPPQPRAVSPTSSSAARNIMQELEAQMSLVRQAPRPPVPAARSAARPAVPAVPVGPAVVTPAGVRAGPVAAAPAVPAAVSTGTPAAAQAPPSAPRPGLSNRDKAEAQCFLQVCIRLLRTATQGMPNERAIEEHFRREISRCANVWGAGRITKIQFYQLMTIRLRNTCPAAAAANPLETFKRLCQARRASAAGAAPTTSAPRAGLLAAAGAAAPVANQVLAALAGIPGAPTISQGRPPASRIRAMKAMREAQAKARLEAAAASAPKGAAKVAANDSPGKGPTGPLRIGGGAAAAAAGPSGVKKPPTDTIAKQKTKKLTAAAAAGPGRRPSSGSMKKTGQDAPAAAAAVPSTVGARAANAEPRRVDDELNVVADIVDIDHEQDTLTAAEQPGVPMPGDTDEGLPDMLLHGPTLRAKVARIMARNGLSGACTAAPLELLSLAAAQRLAGVVEAAADLARARTEKPRGDWETHPDGPDMAAIMLAMRDEEERSLVAAAAQRTARFKRAREEERECDGGGPKEEKEKSKKRDVAAEKKRIADSSQRSALDSAMSGLLKKRKKRRVALAPAGSGTSGGLKGHSGALANAAVGSAELTGAKNGGATAMDVESTANGKGEGAREKQLLTLPDVLAVMAEEPNMRQSVLVYKWSSRVGALRL